MATSTGKVICYSPLTFLGVHMVVEGYPRVHVLSGKLEKPRVQGGREFGMFAKLTTNNKQPQAPFVGARQYETFTRPVGETQLPRRGVVYTPCDT